MLKALLLLVIRNISDHENALDYNTVVLLMQIHKCYKYPRQQVGLKKLKEPTEKFQQACVRARRSRPNSKFNSREAAFSTSVESSFQCGSELTMNIE